MNNTEKNLLSLRWACFAVLLIAVVLRLGLVGSRTASRQEPETTTEPPGEAAEAAQS